jgi:hypothetical protein
VADYEIKSIKSLMSWLQSHRAARAHWYGRIGFGGGKRLWISDEPVTTVQWDSRTTDRVPMYPMTLPSPKDAREWWWRLWDGQITLFLYRNGLLAMACIAAAGTWESLSPWYVCRSKDEFVEIPEKQFRKLVGEPTFGEMLEEYNILGISTRSLWLRNLAASTPPPTKSGASTNSRKNNWRA